MIDKLEMFIALATEEHFGRAAESVGVSHTLEIVDLQPDFGKRFFIFVGDGDVRVFYGPEAGSHFTV